MTLRRQHSAPMRRGTTAALPLHSRRRPESSKPAGSGTPAVSAGAGGAGASALQQLPDRVCRLRNTNRRSADGVTAGATTAADCGPARATLR
jgi:hypothetical protein